MNIIISIHNHKLTSRGTGVWCIHLPSITNLVTLNSLMILMGALVFVNVSLTVTGINQVTVNDPFLILFTIMAHFFKSPVNSLYANLLNSRFLHLLLLLPLLQTI